MKSILFITILFYECNNQISATLQSVPSASKIGDNIDPLSSIDIDYLKNGLVFQFRRDLRSDNADIETRRRSTLDKNFLRFGRGDKSMMRFGRGGDGGGGGGSNSGTIRNLTIRSGNLMRFGRNSNNRMRFGKRDKSMMRFGRADNRMRLGRRSPNLMRFGRSGNDNLDKLERLMMARNEGGKNFMAYGNLDRSDRDMEDIKRTGSGSTETIPQFLLSDNETDTNAEQQGQYIPPLKILYDETGNQPPILVRQFNGNGNGDDENSNEIDLDENSYMNSMDPLLY